MSFPWLLAASLFAAVAGTAKEDPPPSRPGVDLQQVGVVEHLDAQIPENLEFVDEGGRPVRIGQYLRGDKPVVLSLVYFQCPVLCNLVISGIGQALKQTGLTPNEDYRAVTVSIDPTEGPALASERKHGHLQAVGLDPDKTDWAFLTGREDQIRALANAVGFQYAYDAQLKQYAHAAVFFLLTPEGKVSRYVYGVRFPPRDLRLALVEASAGRVGTSFDRVLLTCYRYDPASRRYGFYVNAFFRIGGGLVFVALASMLVVLWRRELRGPRAP